MFGAEALDGKIVGRGREGEVEGCCLGDEGGARCYDICVGGVGI